VCPASTALVPNANIARPAAPVNKADNIANILFMLDKLKIDHYITPYQRVPKSTKGFIESSLFLKYSV
jgi:hypothetical protein